MVSGAEPPATTLAELAARLQLEAGSARARRHATEQSSLCCLTTTLLICHYCYFFSKCFLLAHVMQKTAICLGGVEGAGVDFEKARIVWAARGEPLIVWATWEDPGRISRKLCGRCGRNRYWYTCGEQTRDMQLNRHVWYAVCMWGAKGDLQLSRSARSRQRLAIGEGGTHTHTETCN